MCLQAKEVEFMKQEMERLHKERAELIATVQLKHHESLQYHAEIQRLTLLLNEELRKQSLIQQRDSPVSLKVIRWIFNLFSTFKHCCLFSSPFLVLIFQTLSG